MKPWLRWIALGLPVAVIALGFFAWKQFAAPPQQSQEPPPAPVANTPESQALDTGARPASIAGIGWTVPAGWVTNAPRAMRVATYSVGDAECAVFYFGPGQGGSVDDNIERWAGQFGNKPAPKRDDKVVHGLKVSRVEIAGPFLAPGMDMKSQGTFPNWRLLGAIVEGAQGRVYFKLTGPDAAVKAAATDFDGLLASLH
jgi:hypothetical protein